MRVAIDYTPAITQVAGVGRYTRSLVGALLGEAAPDDKFVLWAAGAGMEIECPTPPGEGPEVSLKAVPIPERWLTAGWQRLRLPVKLEYLIGSVDVVHAPDFVAPPSRSPSVVTIHDLSYLVVPEYAHPNLQQYLSEAVPRTLQRAARVIAVSQQTADDLSERYDLPPERISVIHNGVDPLFVPPNPEERQRVLAQLGVRQPYVLMVGTIEPRKNHRALLKAMALAVQRHRDLSLVIVGRSGWLSEPILAAIDEASRRVSIRHFSRVEDALLPALYASSVALVYPSWYEGFGLPIVEAMASGTVVVTSDRGAMKEVAGDAALLVPPDSPEAIAEAIVRLCEDSALRERMLKAGASRAGQFGWDAAAVEHLRLYREVSDAR